MPSVENDALRRAFDAGIEQALSGDGGRPPLSDDFAFELFLANVIPPAGKGQANA